MKQLQKSSMLLILILSFGITGLTGCIGVGGGASGAGNVNNQDLVMQIKNQLPPVGDNFCGFGIESPPITDADCIIDNQIFYNGKDNAIRAALSTIGNWSDIDIDQLLSKPNPEERYFYFLAHNQGPLTLQCDPGLQNTQPSCQVAMFGNLKFQIDYLLCPNLANQYLTLASNDWTLRLNQIFVHCAARGLLQNQCQSPRNILITTPESLKTGSRFTFTSKEICYLINIEGLELQPLQSGARYNIFNLFNISQ
jgi:hypothetical protein